jgi:hypothetical protein
MKIVPQPDNTEQTPRINVAMIILFFVAMTVLVAVRGQRQCGCIPPGDARSLPIKQTEQINVPGGIQNREAQFDDVNTQQSSETFRKEPSR